MSPTALSIASSERSVRRELRERNTLIQSVKFSVSLEELESEDEPDEPEPLDLPDLDDFPELPLDFLDFFLDFVEVFFLSCAFNL